MCSRVGLGCLKLVAIPVRDVVGVFVGEALGDETEVHQAAVLQPDVGKLAPISIGGRLRRIRLKKHRLTGQHLLSVIGCRNPEALHALSTIVVSGVSTPIRRIFSRVPWRSTQIVSPSTTFVTANGPVMRSSGMSTAASAAGPAFDGSGAGCVRSTSLHPHTPAAAIAATARPRCHHRRFTRMRTRVRCRQLPVASGCPASDGDRVGCDQGCPRSDPDHECEKQCDHHDGRNMLTPAATRYLLACHLPSPLTCRRSLPLRG